MIAGNSKYSSRTTKHVAVKFGRKKMLLYFVSTKDQLSDIMKTLREK